MDVPASLRITTTVTDTDKAWLADLWVREWGGESMITRGKVHHLSEMAALIAWDGEQRVGAATYRLAEDGCELMSLNALAGGKGVGTALLRACEEQARLAGCRRVWLIISNDNLDALRFYQRRGYHLAAVYPGAIDEARKLKPSIPEVGYHGIAVRDEIELEKVL